MTDHDEPQSGELMNTENTIREKIRHVMMIYPRISNSMLQVGMGTSLQPSIWKPIFNAMVREGRILQSYETWSTPSGRSQSYTILQLNPEHYPNAKMTHVEAATTPTTTATA